MLIIFIDGVQSGVISLLDQISISVFVWLMDVLSCLPGMSCGWVLHKWNIRKSWWAAFRQWELRCSTFTTRVFRSDDSKHRWNVWNGTSFDSEYKDIWYHTPGAAPRVEKKNGQQGEEEMQKPPKAISLILFFFKWTHINCFENNVFNLMTEAPPFSLPSRTIVQKTNKKHSVLLPLPFYFGGQLQ